MSLTAEAAPKDLAPASVERRPTLWFVGTSVSIESGGYVDALAPLAARHGFDLINLSIGDQNSVMGCMRVFAERTRFRSGDVVVWEYSLLDHLLGEGPASLDDATSARRLAWAELRAIGVHIVVLMCAPRDHLDARTQAEWLAADDAAQVGIECIDVRDLFREAGISAPIEHYRDDRHPSIDSPLIAMLAERVLRAADTVGRSPHDAAWPLPVPPWRWLDLGPASGMPLPLQTFSNSLLEVQASVLGVNELLTLPDTRRVVALGVVSTANSGAAWCGHPECPPATVRMPFELGYAFLLRATGIPCVRAHVQMLVSAPDWAFRNGFWRAYGHALSDAPGPVAVFGALIEIS